MYKKHLCILLSLVLLSACSTEQGLSQTGHKKGQSSLTEGEEMRLRAWYIDAQKEKMLGNDMAADQLLSKCLEVDPENHAALHDRALIARHNNAPAAALQFAEQAVQLDPKNFWYKSLLADLYLQVNELKKAEETYVRIIRDHPEGFEHNYDLAMVRYQMADLSGALKALEAIEEKTGFSPELFQQKQLLYMESGQSEQAIKDLENAILANPHDPSYYGMLAEVYESIGDEEKALENYQKILEFDPDNGMVHFSLYEYYIRSGEKEKARESILLGFQDELIDIDTKVGILLNYYELSENDPDKRHEALLLCEQLVKTYPNDAKSHAIYGDFLMREGRFAEARESFVRALEEDPSRQVIWSQVLALDSQLEDSEGLLKHSEKALELFPINPSFYLLNAIAKNQKGQSEEAVEILESGKELIVDDDGLLMEFYSSLGDAYHQIGQHSKSDESYDKALQIDPNNVFILNNYSYYLSLRKERLEKAENMARKANELNPNQASFEDTYAWVLYQATKYTEAKKWIEKSLAHGGEGNGVIHEHYGDILFKMGQEEKALSEWKYAKTLGGYSEQLEQKIEEGKLPE